MYKIEKSNDAALPWRVVWQSGSFVRPKGRYSTEAKAKARIRQLQAKQFYKVRGVLNIDC